MNRTLALSCLVVVATLLKAPSVTGQCTMQYNASVYSDAYADNTMVYGTSNSIDNSSTCGCSHGNYQTTSTLHAPNGDVAYGFGGTDAGTSMYINGVYGD